MWKVLQILLISHAACTLAYRDAKNTHVQQKTGFILHPSTGNTTQGDLKRITSRQAESLSSSNEPLPYTNGFVPKINPADIKYLGHPLDGELKPANNYVLIAKTNAHEYSAGGVYIGSKPNKEFAGRVIATGPGKMLEETGAIIPMSVKVGDIVLYDPPVEQPVITYKKQDCVMITEDQIYARVECNEGDVKPLSADDIRPLSDRLLVKVIDSPKKTQSGLVLARSNELGGTIFRATIVAVGPGSYTKDGKLLPVDNFKRGDVVLFSDSAADGGEFNLNRTQHAFVRRSAIVAKV